MKTIAWMVSIGWVLGLCACAPEQSTTPVEEAQATQQPCVAKFQATRAYVSFAVQPDASAFPLAALGAEEIISSLRATGCDPRPDLREHAALVDALHNGALIVTAITFISGMPDAAKVTATEASYGDASAPDARAFTIHVHRAKRFDQAALADPDAQTVEAWRITSIAIE